ncbi:MAG: hypothetical protein KAX66_01805 [Propionivibrio sp.]|nr:hypothetical protein [Propionivibrio sp.]
MVTREELYELVWSAPMIKVAEKFEVSGSYLARVCAELRVPRPERGYWAKSAVGKAPQRPVLPEALPGDPVIWSRTDGFPTPAVPSPRLVPRPSILRSARPVTGIHGLIRGARELFLASRKVDDDSHLKPYKKLLVDVTASRSGLDKALGFANDLFNALESAGYRVLIAPPDARFQREHICEKEVPPKKDRRGHQYGYNSFWSPQRPTVVYVESVTFGLAIIEMTESVEMRYVNGKYIRESAYVPPKSRRYQDHSWTSTRDLPSGRLRLVAYAPYGSVSWSMSFQETSARTLTQDIPRIVKSIEVEVAPMIARLQEAERQAEIRQQRWLAEEMRRRQEEDRRRVAQSVKDSREQLEQVIQAWSKVFSLEQFFRGVEDRTQSLPESERQCVLDRLRLAREFVGTQNPLDFFGVWKTPTERYVPLSQRESTAQSTGSDKDENDDLSDAGR